MNCPSCSGPQEVLRTDALEDGTVRRRRVCLHCGKRWSTIEANEHVYKRALDLAKMFRELQHRVGED